MKGLIRKKNRDDINKAYTVTRLIYLEEEMKRLKEQKKKIKDKNENELRIQTEKLLDENLVLKSKLLNFKIGLRNFHAKKQKLLS